MSKQKKASPTPEGSQDENVLDSLAKASVLDLANSIHAEWKPYLNTEGEMLLGYEMSFLCAVSMRLQKAVSTRNETYENALKLIHELTRKVDSKDKEIKFLKDGYKELCIGYDNIKQLIHEISVRQGKHVEGCDQNFLRIEKVLKRGGF